MQRELTNQQIHLLSNKPKMAYSCDSPKMQETSKRLTGY